MESIQIQQSAVSEQPASEVQEKPKTFEEYIEVHQERWNGILHTLNEKMKNINTLPDLLNVIYCQRQDAVDYYHTMLNKLTKREKEYKQAYAVEYNKMKTNAQIRYSTEAAINAQIEANLADMIYITNLLDNHTRYMQDTIKSIDNLIYGINNRLRVEELMEGVKK